MKNLSIVQKWLSSIAITAGLIPSLSFAQINATFEVGTASLPITTIASSTTQSPFTTITFDAPFTSTPNVFPMTPEFGAGAEDDPCTIRIRNITTTGFDAACLEPINEDRESPAVNFNYIATIPGSVNVPIANSINTVRFESSCSFVSSQIFGPNCDDCTLRSDQSQGFTTQNFMTAFASAPALITQISTTNNSIQGGNGQPGGEPEFLEAAVQANSVGTASFNWTIDRLEAGNGNLNSGETICYLAVEQNGCQELDFSSFGGPESVDFTAVQGGNVDGHDNGATSGEGATFPTGCFTSTPTVIGNARSRNGNNGGILRLVSENSTEAIFTFDEDRVSDTERSHIDEEVSVLAFSSTFTTPVTLSKARITQIGRIAKFTWETSSETFHLGFHLWGETNSGWEQLNRRLILGAQVDTAETNQYNHSIRLNRQQSNEISRFGISTIDNTGFEQFYGPFELNTEYGEDANNEPVDWTSTRAAFEQNMLARGFVQRNGRWRKVSQRTKQRLLNKQLGANRSILNLEFEASGIHSISAESILAVAPNWENVSLNRLALTLNGNAVARDIISDDDKLNLGDQIIMNARQLSGNDGVYLNNYVYQLRLDRSRVQTASYFDATVDGDEADGDEALSTSGMVSVTPTLDKVYSAGINADQPWYDRRLVSRGSPTTANYAIDFSKPIDTEKSAILDFTIFGGIDLGGDVDDHHAQISVNGTQVDDALFDGLTRYSKRVVLPAGLLKQENNVVSVTVVGDTGLFADLILVDTITLSAAEILDQQAGYQFFATTEQTGFKVSLAGAKSSQVYAYTTEGLLTQVNATKSESDVSFANLPGLENLSSDLYFSVTQNRTLPEPINIELASIKLQHTDLGNLLIVAHPSFIGEELSDYADFKRSNGYEVNIVDWLELVETYGYGNNTPQALDNFLAQAFPADSSIDTSQNNLLIVGGHTYDYLGNLDENIVNFVPTHYREVSIFSFTPSDNVFADLDNDQIPDLSVGRWPVRTKNDLTTIIKKSKDWHANKEASTYQDALLISQPNDSSGLNFTRQLDMRLKLPLSQLSEFDSITRISMQELAESGTEDAVQQARQSIENELNEGLDLLSFVGHGGYVSWGFQGVVNTDFIKGLNNHGKPTLLMPLACYTSNYEHPSVNTLAHQWLFAGDQGAVGIHGASVLGEYRENAIFAERYLNNTAKSNTVGEAIYKAKNEMGSLNQMLHNWALLGDPTLPLR